ncbi:MAG: LytTR family DNA-binding domain-containing protein [Bacteroidales bacterium]|nr:LytTR family DNA-binding domain-containing protein [Bacteroidales bacterium]MDD2425204.1 LytTR family DNA-binding domain-containing protein [Bacteroidales bacterium]MDD2813987.1 LytTR family DNA-binding domain-containing protein [Bacteroidales bacterium]MDD3988575.1 LytTR family DNA-binding domain-containing protein [Bacteroidales bacterium]MDD4638149.1 LytTR family DNA-binding domain-containing protein [Bacteroidales bacterium]
MQSEYRAIVVDDERLARQRLIKMLNRFDNIKVIGEASDVTSAKILIEKSKPDIIFLDIQMPRQSGFDLLEKTRIDGRVVFVTAYDNYAIRAFEANALDYLMKPVCAERLERMISKLDKEAGDDFFLSKLSYQDKLFVSDNRQMRFIDIKDITHIQSTGNYSKLVLNTNEKILIYRPLKEWEKRLPGTKFCRIHRTAIVNIDYIEKIEKWFNYSCRIYLSGNSNPLLMSKSYAGIFRERFS